MKLFVKLILKKQTNIPIFYDSMKLTYEWCKCVHTDESYSPAIYATDNSCSCGVGKHHYHCSKCGAIEQVG